MGRDRLIWLVSPSDSHVYSIRDARTSVRLMEETFANLMLAMDMAQALSNLREARLEIVREDGSIVIAIDPEHWHGEG